jgi:TolA-binding protein
MEGIMKSATFPAVLPALAGLALLAGCGGREPPVEARLALALDMLQQGRLDDAARQLSGVKARRGWLAAPAYPESLALRLRTQIAVRLGAREEAISLLDEYSRRYPSMAPCVYAQSRLDLFRRFKDNQGAPALLFVRGLESEDDSPAISIREWRNLLRDYPRSALSPAAQLKLGLLQKRLGNAAWALADLAGAAEAAPDAVDAAGNAVAPQALLAMGQVNRDLLTDNRAARTSFEAVGEKFGKLVLADPVTREPWSPALMAGFELADMEGAAATARLEALAKAGGRMAFVSDEYAGNASAEANLRLADLMLKRGAWSDAAQRMLTVAKDHGEELCGARLGARRAYAFEVADRLEARLGNRAPDEALKALATLASASRFRESWAWASLKRVRLLARLGRQKEAREVLGELERRYPKLDVEPFGDGLVVIPAKEARRTLGG